MNVIKSFNAHFETPEAWNALGDWLIQVSAASYLGVIIGFLKEGAHILSLGPWILGFFSLGLLIAGFKAKKKATILQKQQPTPDPAAVCSCRQCRCTPCLRTSRYRGYRH